MDQAGLAASHNNFHMYCVLDVETSGLNAGHHDLLQVCALPLNALAEVDERLPPFYMNLKPKQPQNADPQAMKVNGLKIEELKLNGVDPWKAADLFEDWFQKLPIPEGKKLIPIAHNWPFDRSFLLEWLTMGTFNHIFDYHPVDTCGIARYINDWVVLKGERRPFTSVRLRDVASYFGIDQINAHDALSDCITTAKIFKNFLTFPFSKIDTLANLQSRVPPNEPPAQG